MKRLVAKKILTGAVIFCCAVLFSLMIVYFHVKEIAFGHWHHTMLHERQASPPPASLREIKLWCLEDGAQKDRHVALLEGRAGNPWQYRVLSTFAAEGVITLVKRCGIAHPMAVGFLLVRIVQGILIFGLVGLYYRKLGFSTYLSLLGMSVLAWGMSYANYDNPLTLDSYSDVIFYLVAGLVILEGRHVWIIPVTALAALNRETCGLIPFLLVADALARKVPRGEFVRICWIAAIALGAYAAAFFGLRYFYGPQKLLTAYGNEPGWDYLWYNVSRYQTYLWLFATLGILPVLAFVSFRRWPRELRAFFWALVPVWVIVHAFVSIFAETRLFLVPHALVVVPGVLSGIARGEAETPSSAVPPPG